MEIKDNTYPLPGWLFRIVEVSNGRYLISLTDRHKRRVEVDCGEAEIEEKLRECIAWAQQFELEA